MGNANTMISVTNNIGVVIKAKLEQITALKNNIDPVMRTVAIAVLAEMKDRVHTQGKDSSGNQIGTYSPGYMKLRTGDYKNSGRNVKGKNKGQLKDTGTFTKGKVVFEQAGFAIEENLKGKARPAYHRSSDPKVIISLTRQMENDESVVATGTGYGIGFLNHDNFLKVGYVEETYNKKILTKLTTEEVALAKKTAEEFLPEYIKTL